MNLYAFYPVLADAIALTPAEMVWELARPWVPAAAALIVAAAAAAAVIIRRRRK